MWVGLAAITLAAAIGFNVLVLAIQVASISQLVITAAPRNLRRGQQRQRKGRNVSTT
jgi:hypothetical protein